MRVRMGDMESAVDHNIWPEMPSGPDAVLILWVERSFCTSSVEQVIKNRLERWSADCLR